MEMNLCRYLTYILTLALVFLLSACENKNNITMPGYVEAQYIYISSTYPGILQVLSVAPGDQVELNSSLYSLDPSPEKNDSASMTAQIKQARSEKDKIASEFKLHQSMYNRKRNLYQQRVISRDDWEIIQSNYEKAKAAFASSSSQIEQLQAQLNKSSWAMEQKTVKSPIKAQVYDTYYSVGELIPMNSPVLSLLVPSNIKIIFYVSEIKLGSIKINQEVLVHCDGCKKITKAKITYISPQAEFTPPVIYSTDVRSKLTFRVEALPVDLERQDRLYPGQPVTVELNA